MVLTVTCLHSDLDLAMHLLRTALLDPVVRENEYSSALAMLKNEGVRQAGTCAGMFASEGRRFLAGGTGYLADLDYSLVKGFSLEEVRGFVATAFKQGPVTLCVAGDFVPGIVEKAVGRFFGTMQQRTRTSRESMHLAFPAGERSMARINRALPQAGVIMALPVSVAGDEAQENEILLGLLRRIVADRLRLTLRETLGAAYSPVAYLMQPKEFPGYGYMAVQVETEAGKHELVEQAVRAILVDLASNGVIDEELDRARKQALGLRVKLASRLGFWRYQLLQVASGHRDAFMRAAKASQIISEAEAAQLSDLAERYFVPEKAAVFTVLPPDLQ
ncbi:M16 family metallopeptidase [Salidesulfovibrio onnuriiensis]|uniref:M16 family metallopeptidase n=1 Tax=Salidesulfovibrio onnuriiensis TaxID=2583823 RepID=UPI00164F433E|nr:insulinase family protein [Salidesulfovibrio onnuriiensis]